ncbi:MAG: hypothetical protein Fur0037_16070 [Planctomycetota bacterium]
MRTIALLTTFAASAAAQISFTLPAGVQPANNTLPFAGGIGRYQQWYRGSDIAANAQEPMRITQIDFFRGTGQQLTTTLDLEISIGHGYPFGPNGVFDQSFSSPPQVVFPRRTVTLSTVPAGAVALSFPFSTPFTWDGQSAVVIDVKVYGNGQANQGFNYDFQSTSAAFGQVTRLYALGNANAQYATSVQPSWGLFTQFTMRSGVNVPYGTGCPGALNHVPQYTVGQLAWPGIIWTHQVTNASSQRTAIWVLGMNRAQWGSLPLPADLGPLVGATGCLLWTRPDYFAMTQTVGGGPGSGIATFSLQLPPVTVYVGMSFYTQWLVLDPFAPNGVGAASAANRAIVAPVGG